jgi:hypothetical protein
MRYAPHYLQPKELSFKGARSYDRPLGETIHVVHSSMYYLEPKANEVDHKGGGGGCYGDAALEAMEEPLEVSRYI